MSQVYLAHHGILGQKWGVRRYQNPDGSLTEAGKKRYNEAVSDAKKHGEIQARLERTTRKLTSGVKENQQILVTPEVKADYKRQLDSFLKSTDTLTKKYGDIKTNVKSMDDGYDYIQTLIKYDNKNYLEYMTVIGKSQN